MPVASGATDAAALDGTHAEEVLDASFHERIALRLVALLEGDGVTVSDDWAARGGLR
jgi:hypothetical protein